jgi:glutathione synthase/RimK-type ligase-like ATP-grasp enzyme
MSSKKILIVTKGDDSHLPSVMHELARRGKADTAVVIDPPSIVVNGSISVELSNQNTGIFLKAQDGILCTEDVKSIWWRRPTAEIYWPNDYSKFDIAFANAETRKTLQGIWKCIDALWINHPSNIANSGLKIEQLKHAKTIGLRIPSTLVTSNCEDALAFYEQNNGKIIYKTLCCPVRHTPGVGTQQYSIYTTLQEKTAFFKNLPKIKHVPCLFQEYIDKECEYRLTIIGEDVFIAEINSQAQAGTKIDWRDYSIPMRVRKGTLPGAIVSKCIQLVRDHNLIFSTIDIIKTPSGDYVFLENNPNGQWQFIEMLVPEFKMTSTLVNYLIAGK